MTEKTAIATQGKSDIVEQVVIGGDLSKLSPDQRVEYYRAVCQSLGLNPLTKPFDYITLNGKLTLYAKRDCTDQLRARHSITVNIVSRERLEEVYVVTARATEKDGRADESIGAVNIANLKGDFLANAMMKAETKAKRRATLSLVGLGWLDETETETIRDATPVGVDPKTGEIIDGKVEQPTQKRAAKNKLEDPPAPKITTWNEYWTEIRGPLGLTTKDGNAFLEEVGAELGGAPDSALLAKALELARASRK